MTQGGKKPVSGKVQSLLDSLKRRSGVRELNQRFLIVCEDDKSAPRYFEALKRWHKLDAAKVEVVGSSGWTQPVQVVDRAIKLKHRSLNEDESGTEPFNEVWCCIDGDYDSKICNARSKAKTQGIQLAVTNKCFEFWILLHFEESARIANDCDEHYRDVKRHVPSYSKGGFDFSTIVPHARTASKRAKKSRRTDELPESQNPCSDLYLLIDQLLPEST